MTPGTQVGHFGRGPDFGRIPCGVPGATSEAPRLQRASLVQGAARVAEGETGGSRGAGGGHLGGGSPAHLPLLHSLLRSAAPTPPNAHFLTVSSQYFGSFRVFITFQYVCKKKWSWVNRKIFQVFKRGCCTISILHNSSR